MLDYVRSIDVARYREIVAKLGLRRTVRATQRWVTTWTVRSWNTHRSLGAGIGARGR